MWIMDAEGGFTSTVAYDPVRAGDSARAGGDFVLVRGRVREDVARFAGWAGEPCVVVADPGADYRWRVVLSRDGYRRALLAAVDRLDYTSHYKETARERAGGVSPGVRYDALLDTWSVWHRVGRAADGRGRR